MKVEKITVKKKDTLVNGYKIKVPFHIVHGESVDEYLQEYGEDVCTQILRSGINQAYRQKANQLLARGKNHTEIVELFEQKEWYPCMRSIKGPEDKLLKQFESLSEEQREAFVYKLSKVAAEKEMVQRGNRELGEAAGIAKDLD